MNREKDKKFEFAFGRFDKASDTCGSMNWVLVDDQIYRFILIYHQSLQKVDETL